MSNLQKFNQTIEDFSLEVNQLKDVSRAYRKFQQLVETYNELFIQFEENSKTLSDLNQLQKAQQEKVIESLVGIESANKRSAAEISQITQQRTDQISRENKDFYKDFESTLKIKLDENKSKISHIIEDERNHIKNIFEIEIAKNTKELCQVIQLEIEKQNKLLLNNQNTIKLSLFILCGLTLIMTSLAVFKLWVNS
jgi:ribosomal protein S17E